MAYRKKQKYARHPLPSNDEYWVELRRLSIIDVQTIQRIHFGELRAGGQTEGVTLKQVDSASAVVAILEATIRGWNLDEELPDGTTQPLPIAEETLVDLEPEDMEFILHTAVKGTLLEQAFGRATIAVQEVEDAPNGAATPDEVDSLFTVGPSRP